MERSGLRQLLEDAREKRFNIVLAEALDRLSRDQADIATIFKRTKFAGIDIVTLSEGRVGIVDIGLRGTMNQLYSIETANKVRRGRIKEGKAAGGISYGYDVVRKFDAKGELIRGERKINESQAQVVRRIYRDYAARQSPRTIACRLNNEGVPGPVGKEWTQSTIIGNPRMGVGILNNPLYVGQLVWNRRTYIKDPETGRRVYRINPESEWTLSEVPNLRIVEQQVWDKVRDRQQRMSCPKAVAALRTLRGAIGQRRPRFLLSGLVKCGCCGGGFAIRRRDHFSCATFENRGTCSNRLGIKRKNLEDKVLRVLKQKLAADPERCAAFCEAYARQLKDLRIERNELVQAFRDELVRVEAEYDRITDVPKRGHVRPTFADDLIRVTLRHSGLLPVRLTPA